MLTIELDILVTIAVGIASIAVSSLATWYFSRRYYLKSEEARAAQNNPELEMVKTVARSSALALIVTALVFMAIIGFYALVVVLAHN